MRLYEILKNLDEYKLVQDQKFNIPSAVTGSWVGQIRPRGNLSFVVDVYYLKDSSHEIYFAVSRDIGPSTPIGYCGFKSAPGPILYSVNAYVEPQYQKQGILSELMLFVKKHTQLPILSDTHLTQSGKNLWHSLAKSPFFDLKIIDLKTQTVFDVSDVGQILPNGDLALDPKDDNTSDSYYDLSTDQGQRFFYILESPQQFDIIEENQRYQFGYRLDQAMAHSILSPMGYFKAGDL